MDRLAFGLKMNALEPAREQPARPLPGGNRLQARLARRRQHDKTGQVIRFRAQPIEQPRTHAGAALDN